ncbi:hypothetical protein OQX61_09045 [Pedobacter sp. PLR]|uniref:hypothetical protein n=1 Tax=Pedobacter sp. PLR TaxID=2994465 RepID=UPI002247E3C0|nr:hypothetical protein [Pedobacter sp. PLR]MCX2451416.1 hypothetical protein [Pedobacter sp. PLR]
MYLFRILITAVLLAVTLINTKAQTINPSHIGTAKGILRDTVHNYVLKSATVSIYKAADSTLLSYQISNNYGEFKFNNLPVNLLLKVEISHVGYQALSKKFTIPAAKNLLDLQTMIVKPRDISLQEVMISIPPVSMNGDTLEFNASAFKLDSNAVVEDLLRKIPNITLWGDGQITVNGREVKSILVNGKPFFGGDTKMATQNIAKNALEKIQVYNTIKNKSNPLDSTLEVNLKLKKGKDIGYFGKIGAGYGTNKRYESDLSFNIFSPKMEIALIGASNNVNKIANNIQALQSNSTFKGVGTNVAYQPDFRTSGLHQPNAGGVAFTYNFIEKPTYDKKNSLNSNYFLQNKNSENLYEAKTTTTLNNNEIITEKNSRKTNDVSTNHKFDSKYEWVKKNKSLNISQYLTVNQGETNSGSFRAAENGQNILTSTNNSINQSNYKNTSFNLFANYVLGQNYMKYNQRFKGFNATYNLTVNENSAQRLNITEFKSYTDPGANKNFNRKYDTQSEGINQQIDVELPNIKSIIFGNSKLAGIDFSITNNLNINHNKDHNRVKDLDEASQNYQNNDYLTNQIQTNVINETTGLNIKKTFSKSLSNRFNKDLSFNLSPNQQFIYQNNQSDRSFQNIKRSYSQFLPNATASYVHYQYGDFYKSYRLNYTTTLHIPTIYQLAPLTDSTNLYALQKGNVNLKAALEKKIHFSYSHTDQTNKNTLNYNLNFSAGTIKNNIVDSVLIDDQNRRTIYLVNADGHKYINFYGSIRKAIKLKTSEIQVSLNTSINSSRQPGYTNDVFSFSKNFNTNTALELNYTYKSDLALVLGESFSTYQSKQEAFNTEYSGKTLTTTLRSSYNITKKLTLNNIVSFNSSAAAATKTVNFTIWNANATYRFLKGNNAEFKFSALDLLRENNSIINYGNANGFTVGTQNVLEQYFMITFSYYPRQFGKKGVKK